MATKKLPKDILVYQIDEVEGQPIYAVALNVEDVPEHADGQKIGVYSLNRESLFRVRRELT